MSNLLYYAQVNESVRNEIRARANSALSRTNEDLAFMLEKIANVEVLPYDTSTITADSKPIEEAILGGFKIREGSFQPSGPQGFLSDSNSVNRTKPYLSQVSIQTYDQSRGYLNRGKIDIIIPDPANDMDLIESVYCRPGRTLKLRIQHPESAVLTTNNLADDALVDYDTLKQAFPNTTEDEIRKLNLVTFNGKISNFTYSYESDGSVKLSVDMLGTTGTYINASTYIGNSEENENDVTNNPDNNENKKLSSLYQTLLKEVDATLAAAFQVATNSVEFTQKVKNIEISVDGNGKSILVGNYYNINNRNRTEGTQYKFVSLGYLVEYINKKIFSAINNESTDRKVECICDDRFCKSNYREHLVSADPTRILLWSGTNNASNVSKYPSDKDIEDLKKDAEANRINNPSIINVPPVQLNAFAGVEPKTPGFLEKGNAFPARIYINLLVIDELLEKVETDYKEPTIKDFFNLLSTEISRQLGGEISMKLIEHPVESNILMYYDINYIDKGIAKTEEFVIPGFDRKGASAIRDISITTNVPDSVKSMIYGLDAATKSFNSTTVYSAYIFGSDDTRKKIEADYEKNHLDALKNLKTAKLELAQNAESLDEPGPPINEIIKLQNALKGYLMYPTPKFGETVTSSNPVFPMEITVTLDGINGFKYGDVMNFSGIPEKYIRRFAFMVIGITHTVNNDGDWSTQLQLKARIKQQPNLE